MEDGEGKKQRRVKPILLQCLEAKGKAIPKKWKKVNSGRKCSQETFYWIWQLRDDSVTRDTDFMMSFEEVN